MYSRHQNFPVYQTLDSEVSALHFNHVQYALKQLGGEIRLSLPKLRSLDLILQKNAWVIVDRSLNDVPIAVWTGFSIEKRDNLHQPINCSLKYFHMHAGLVIKRSLEAMELMLGELLPGGDIENPAHVLSIDKKT